MEDETKRWILDLTAWTLGLLAGMVLIAHEAMAGGGVNTPVDDRWKAECGSCHIAYPPRLLPARAWRRVMSQLDRHFGTDATLDPPAVAQIASYLESNAAAGRAAQSDASGLRITETAWFVREHAEVPIASWTHSAVKSASNCAACHRLAAQGDFRERSVRIPR